MEVLRKMLAQNPRDSFARYGLAMEYGNAGELEKAVAEFRVLLEHHPDYAAAYFHGGRALEKLGRVGDARAMYQQGIQVTSRTGDHHTRSELEGALDLLPG
jgi:tetratricopeptide (TPR) repeat protein